MVRRCRLNSGKKKLLVLLKKKLSESKEAVGYSYGDVVAEVMRDISRL